MGPQEERAKNVRISQGPTTKLGRATWSERRLLLSTGKACTSSCLGKKKVRSKVSHIFRPTGSLMSNLAKKAHSTLSSSQNSFIDFQFPSCLELSPAGFDRSLRLSATGADDTPLHQTPP